MGSLGVIEGCDRSIVQSFAKRIPCNCLDKEYSKMKSQPKTGVFHYFKERKNEVLSFIIVPKRPQEECKMLDERDFQIVDLFNQRKATRETNIIII